MRMSLQIIWTLITLASVSGNASAEEIETPLKQALPDCAECFDVVGIRLRSSCEAASKVPGYKIASKQEDDFWGPHTQTKPYLRSFDLVSTNPAVADTIKIECTSPLIGNRVDVIVREIDYRKADAKPDIADLKKRVFEKYGNPSASGGDKYSEGVQYILDTKMKRVILNKIVEIGPNQSDQQKDVSAVLFAEWRMDKDKQKAFSFGVTAVDLAAMSLDKAVSEAYREELDKQEPPTAQAPKL